MATQRLTPAMESLLRSAADDADGRAYNNGAAGFLRTHDALVRRGYFAEHPDGGAGVITDAGREAIGRPLTAAELADRAARTAAAEAAAAERARVDSIARDHGWRPAIGDRVTLPDGTAATVAGGGREVYACRDCAQRHPFPDVVTERQSVMGAAACRLAPTVETARAWLLGRATHLDAEIAAVPGYPANERWAAEASVLRAAAAELAPVAPLSVGRYADLCLTCGQVGCTEHRAEQAELRERARLAALADQDDPDDRPGESAHTIPGDAERTAEVEQDAAELASIRSDEAAELAAELPAELAAGGFTLRLPAGVRLRAAGDPCDRCGCTHRAGCLSCGCTCQPAGDGRTCPCCGATDPVAKLDALGAQWSPDFGAYAAGELDASAVRCVLCGQAPCECPPFGTDAYFALVDQRHGKRRGQS